MNRNLTAAWSAAALGLVSSLAWLSGCSGDDTPASTCGDNVLSESEACDDGNVNTGDGCSASCRVEIGWTCVEGLACSPVCGDSVVVGSETCDDGNTVSGDGCSARCTSEAPVETECANNVDDDLDGATDCADSDCEGVAPCAANPENCGNGVDDDGDELVDCADPDCGASLFCDTGTERNCADGLDNDSDGAIDCDDLDCECGGPTCGDGTVDVDEQCDDGAENSDTRPNACRTNCRIARCGDGVTDMNEECDDGDANSVNGTCTPACLRPPLDCTGNGAAVDLFDAAVAIGPGRFLYEGQINATSGNNFDTTEACGASGNDVLLYVQAVSTLDGLIRIVPELTTAPVTLSLWDGCQPESELQICADGVEGRLLAASFAENQAVYLVVDSAAPAGGTFAVEFFQPQDIVGAGEPCDPSNALAPCIDRYSCRSVGDGFRCVDAGATRLGLNDLCDPSSTAALCGDGLACSGNRCVLREGGSCETLIDQEGLRGMRAGTEVSFRTETGTFYRALPARCTAPEFQNAFEVEVRGTGVLTVDVSLPEGVEVGSPSAYLREYCNIRASEAACDWTESDDAAHIELPVDDAGDFSLHVGGASELDVVVRLLPYVSLGEACDESGELNRCSPGLRCSSGGECVQPEPGTCGAPLAGESVGSGTLERAVIFTPDVLGLGDLGAGSCSPVEGAWDTVYSVNVPGKGELTLELQTDLENVSLFVRSTCLDEESELACGGFEAEGDGVVVKRIPVEAGLNYIFVSAENASSRADLGTMIATYEPVGRFGDQCEFSEDCRDGLYCLFTPDAPFSTCVWLELFPGEACTVGLAPCVEGHACSGTIEEPEGTCEPIESEGSAGRPAPSP